MSVSISRFVDVMRDNRPWGKKGRAAKDAEAFAALGRMQAVLDTLKSAAPDKGLTELQSRHDALARELDAAGNALDSKKIQAAELDDIARRAGAALAAAEAYAGDMQRRTARQQEIKLTRARAISPASNIAQIDSTAVQKEYNSALAALNARIGACDADTDYSPSRQSAILAELAAISKDLSDLGRHSFSGIPPKAAAFVQAQIDEAAAQPKSDIGRMAAAINPAFVKTRLEILEKNKLKYGVDFRPLSTAEALAIETYTDTAGDYKQMHALLLGKIAEDPKIRTKIEMCIQALKKLPDYPARAQPTFRQEDGGNYPWDQQFVQGRVFPLKIFWSTGKTGVVEADAVTGPRLIVTVYGKTGKDVAKMSGAAGEGGGEVLYPPGTRFKTLAIERPYDIDAGGKRFTPATAKVFITVQEV